MQLTTEISEEILIIHIEGRLDAITTAEFDNSTKQLLLQNPSKILIDFNKLSYISSAGLRSLLILAKEMKNSQRSLAICCLNETIKEVFCISGFDTIISIYPTIEEGLIFLK